MFSFEPIDLLLVFLGALLLLAGMSLLALRRRNEILQDFLTPDNPELEVEFFKRKEVVETEPETVQEESETSHENEETATWGEIAEASDSNPSPNI